MSRHCYTCGEQKELAEFVRDKRKRSGYGYQCKQCMRLNSNRWYGDNRSRTLSRQAAYYAANRKAIQERRKGHHRRETEEERSKRRSANGDYKRYWTENREKCRASRNDWDNKHPGYYANYHRTHREQIARRGRKWLERNPERHLERCRRRRARKLRAGGNFTAEQWLEMKKSYQHTCLRCGKTEPEIQLTVDHVIPLLKGGRHEEENIQPLCGSCNKSKGTKTIDYR